MHINAAKRETVKVAGFFKQNFSLPRRNNNIHFEKITAWKKNHKGTKNSCI